MRDPYRYSSFSRWCITAWRSPPHPGDSQPRACGRRVPLGCLSLSPHAPLVRAPRSPPAAPGTSGSRLRHHQRSAIQRPLRFPGPPLLATAHQFIEPHAFPGRPTQRLLRVSSSGIFTRVPHGILCPRASPFGVPPQDRPRSRGSSAGEHPWGPSPSRGHSPVSHLEHPIIARGPRPHPLPSRIAALRRSRRFPGRPFRILHPGHASESGPLREPSSGIVPPGSSLRGVCSRALLVIVRPGSRPAAPP